SPPSHLSYAGSSISVVVPIQRRAGGSDAGDDPAEVYKYMLVDVTCQRYTVSTEIWMMLEMCFGVVHLSRIK
ncbi:hypothetical protein ACJX0J_033449, partial [Zea mays]